MSVKKKMNFLLDARLADGQDIQRKTVESFVAHRGGSFMFAFFNLGGPELLVLLFFGVFCFGVLWLWPLVDCLRNESSQGNDKIIWVLLIVLLGSLGGLLYLIIRRPKRIQELGK